MQRNKEIKRAFQKWLFAVLRISVDVWQKISRGNNDDALYRYYYYYSKSSL